MDRSLELGVAWARLGMAFVSNGLASDHREYLARGGLGFLLGDGALRYGRERILEAYYTFSLGLGLFLAADVQHIVNPRYNRERGPVTVFALQAHLEVIPFSSR